MRLALLVMLELGTLLLVMKVVIAGSCNWCGEVSSRAVGGMEYYEQSVVIRRRLKVMHVMSFIYPYVRQCSA
jgi:hypothetical protein